jgi:hypothetical protein
LSDANHSTVFYISIDSVLLADLPVLVKFTDPPTLEFSRSLMNCPRNVQNVATYEDALNQTRSTPTVASSLMKWGRLTE